MKILKILLGIVAAVVVLPIFGKVRQQQVAASAPASSASGKSAASAKDPGLSPAGFFLVSRDHEKNPCVTIMSPPNCPSEEAAGARMLESSLQSAGIPTEMKPEIGFEFHDPEDTARASKYMNNVANPLVLVRGWAKGNPKVEDVIAQYCATR